MPPWVWSTPGSAVKAATCPHADLSPPGAVATGPPRPSASIAVVRRHEAALEAIPWIRWVDLHQIRSRAASDTCPSCLFFHSEVGRGARSAASIDKAHPYPLTHMTLAPTARACSDAGTLPTAVFARSANPHLKGDATLVDILPGESLAPSALVLILSCGMITTPILCLLVSAAGFALAFSSRQRRTGGPAIALSAVAEAADRYHTLTLSTAVLSVSLPACLITG